MPAGVNHAHAFGISGETRLAPHRLARGHRVARQHLAQESRPLQVQVVLVDRDRRTVAVRVAWIGYLDPFVYSGGGELNQRALILAGRKRGHDIEVSGFLRDRPQRVLRRLRLHRHMKVDWAADIFLLANLRNCPHIRARLPQRIVERALATGRAAVFQEAWVDVCSYDMPCGGDRSRCLASCDRSYANYLYSHAQMAMFNSPMQHQMIASVIDVPLPGHQLLSPPMIDVDRFRDEGLPRDIDVLYVGTINKAKGYYNLLERFGEDRLTLAGPNHLGEPVRGKYSAPIPNEDLPALYNRARIFAHLPEWYEPMGRRSWRRASAGAR